MGSEELLQWSVASVSVRSKKDTSPLNGGSNQPVSDEPEGIASHASGVSIAPSSRRFGRPAASLHSCIAPRSPYRGAMGDEALCASMRQRTPSTSIEVTAHTASPTITERALGSDPNPSPPIVRCVPPAREPLRGEMRVIRGSTCGQVDADARGWPWSGDWALGGQGWGLTNG